MNIAIIQFPGSNCERETELAVRRVGMQPVDFLWNDNPEILGQCEGFILVGGFSYEDRSRAGIIAALDPVMFEIKRQAELGKPVLGICNGAQILVESGLVPALNSYETGMALAENKRIQDGKILGTGFYNAWVYLRLNPQSRKSAFNTVLPKDYRIKVPVAHAQGRFLMSSSVKQVIEEQALNLFQYCDENGQPIDNFPVNPNGSVLNSAAITNLQGNVMAMMPHPERTAEGDGIFLSMKDYILNHKSDKQSQEYTVSSTQVKLQYQPLPITNYQTSPSTKELFVKLIITDNSAISVQKTLNRLGYEVKVSRLVYWKLEGVDQQWLERINTTGVLFNDRKEYLVSKSEFLYAQSQAYLVLADDDMLGRQKTQILNDHFSIDFPIEIHHGVLWIFEGEGTEWKQQLDSVLDTHIIYNPYSHRCYHYENK